ncbi:hypothetical protein [Burkholderia ubonensis]|nr:hypothetical protein [Burkholderia ubonensis]
MMTGRGRRIVEPESTGSRYEEKMAGSSYNRREASDRALELIKASLSSGALHPITWWNHKPEEAGKQLGEFVGAAVEALAEKIEKL